MHPLDLLLTGARVIDPETGLDDQRTVGIVDGRIASVGPATDRPPARAELDLSGLILAPGFIDLHSHAQDVASQRVQAHDGVTTALELEAGASPVEPAYAAAAATGRPIHYGYSASWATTRMQLLDGAPPGTDFFGGIGGTNWHRPADRSEQARILDHLEGELAAGALGIGVLVGYAPRTTREEYAAVAALAARHGVPTYTHARFKNQDGRGDSGDSGVTSNADDTAAGAIAEIVDAARSTGAHMHVCHLNSTTLRAIEEIEPVLESARRDGLRVTTEGYPYGAGMTAIGAPFLAPERLSRLGIGPSNLALVLTGERPADDDRLRQLRTENPAAPVIIHYLDDDEPADRAALRRILMVPDTAVASDAIGYRGAEGTAYADRWPLPDTAASHPRTAGTFARFWTMMVRDGGLSPLEAARRCSLIPATILERVAPAMRNKGRVQVGADADLVALDPDGFADRSTYAAPARRSTGVAHLLVGGVALIRDGELRTDVLPGRPIRGDRRDPPP